LQGIRSKKVVWIIKLQIILPIHDWHWNNQAREAFYKRLKVYFGNIGIDFIELKTGQTVSL